jgi:aspartate-semialdehyde dehydrogenase
MRLAIVGATGMVGQKFIELLEEYDTSYDELFLFASSRSAGNIISVKGCDYTVLELTHENIKSNPCDFALFSAGGSTSLEFAPIFVETGAVVVDNSSAYRMDDNVPLIVPEVNPLDAFRHQGIIANPNCSTIQSVLPVKAVDSINPITRINYATYQAVSGSGVAGVKDLEKTSRGEEPSNYGVPIYSNVIPQIDVFLENGFTKEEVKMIKETQKILGKEDLEISATCCRVPVINGHSVDIEIACVNEIDLDDVYSVLNQMPGVILYDDTKNEKYPHPRLADGSDAVFVGRVRKDLFNPKIVRLFCSADNIRKGAASNTIQIMELLRGGN